MIYFKVNRFIMNLFGKGKI